MFLEKLKVLLAKEESVYGSDPTPTVASNSIEAMNIKLKYRGDVLERDIQRETLSPVAPVIGQRSVEISFSVELKGSGSAGTAPRLGDLLEACGFNETVSAGSSVIYTPASSTMKSITIYQYDLADAGSCVLHKITGCRGTAKMTLEAGKLAMIDFTFQGLYNAPTDVANPGTPTFESSIPAIVQSSQFTLNDVTSLVAQKIDLDFANSVQQSDDINSAGGIKSFNIVGRKPTGAFNPEAVVVATYDFWTDWLAATQRAMSAIVGSEAGNTITVSAPKVTIDNIDNEERNGVVIRNIPFRCSLNSGNDELQIKFA
jgi:hypothetical protein